MTHTTMKTFAILLLVSLGLSFSSISSGFAQEIKAPPALTPVKSAWEPWDKKTLQLQLLVIPAAIGVGAANSFFSRTVYKSRCKPFLICFVDEDRFAWFSAGFGYTLS